VGASTATSSGASRSLVPRTLLALVAVVLVAAFGLLARNEAVGTAASQRVVGNPGMGAAEWQRTMEDLRDAELLDPSTEWTLKRAQFLLLHDHQREAIAVADSVLEREPDNLDAWWVIVRAARDVDRARWREAVAEVRRLNPPQ
jgi:hypothetical protein